MIWKHLYMLGDRKGALIKVLTENGAGFADVHPWPELGDDPLERQLDLLQMGVLTPLTKQSLRFCEIDAKARENKESVFQSLAVPDSHYLLPRLDQASVEEVVRAEKEGFRVFKVKMGKDLPRELRLLKTCLAVSSANWRLDFNGRLDENGRTFFLSEMSTVDSIEFCEDPFAHSCGPFPLPIAKDFVDAKEYQFRIVKPAVDDWMAIKETVPIVYTSYLGHPVGQCTDAYVSGRQKCQAVCGLHSHRVYPKNPFSERLSWSGPKWQSPGGTGWGFDDLLDAISWERVI